MTTTTPSIGGQMTAQSSQAQGRFTRLSDQVRALRTKAGTGSLDRWLLVVGGVLMPLGGVLIILAWVGASRTPLPFEQTDYLISGGVLGLALVIAGGFVYFAYWQSVRIRESRQQASELAGAMARLEVLLSGGAAGVAPTATGAPAAAAPTTFVATANGSIYHRPDCQVVVGRDDVRPVEPASTDLRPCRICEPDTA